MTAFFNSRDGEGYGIREPYVGQVSGWRGRVQRLKFKFVTLMPQVLYTIQVAKLSQENYTCTCMCIYEI